MSSGIFFCHWTLCWIFKKLSLEALKNFSWLLSPHRILYHTWVYMIWLHSTCQAAFLTSHSFHNNHIKQLTLLYPVPAPSIFFLCLRLSIFGSCLDPHPSDLSICIKYLVQCLAHSISLQVYGTIIITSLFRDLRVNSKYVPTKHSLFILPRVYTPNPYPIVYLISWAQKQRHKTEKSTEDGRYLKWSSWAG